MQYQRFFLLTAPAVAVAVLTVRAIPAAAQATRPTSVETDMVKDPGGTPLLHLPKGTPLVTGAAQGGWIEATIDGWIPANALKNDKRDGFDVSVSLPAGTTLRERPGAGATLASARLGTLFDRVEARGAWVHVKRTGWVSQAATVAPRPAAPTPRAAAPVATVAKPPPAVAAPLSVAAGAALAATAGGSPVATLESPLHAEVLERKGGWTHVRIDAWVRDAALGNALSPSSITAADIRAAPDKYVGQTVEWTVELLGIQKADELRPELPAGQPYLLARGPLPESGFVYIAITNDEVNMFNHLEPLAKIRIRATIRAGRTRYLPTPVLNFIRLLQ